MIPGEGEYLSFLMGASSVSDDELKTLGAEILHGAGTALRGLRIPSRALGSYRELIRAKLQPGFWNDVVGQAAVFFMFKMRDGTIAEFTYSPENREEISRLCSQLNSDPIEKTSNILRYMAANPFYRDTMVECHGVVLE
jgi:hypothetical protein